MDFHPYGAAQHCRYRQSIPRGLPRGMFNFCTSRNWRMASNEAPPQAHTCRNLFIKHESRLFDYLHQHRFMTEHNREGVNHG